MEQLENLNGQTKRNAIEKEPEFVYQDGAFNPSKEYHDNPDLMCHYWDEGFYHPEIEPNGKFVFKEKSRRARY